MFFLIRFAIKFCFWMMLVSLFMPGDRTSGGAAGPGPLEALLAAQETIGDLSGFCARQPQACETGKAALSNAGSRAGDVAKAGFDYLDARFGKDGRSPDAAIATAHDQASGGGHADLIKQKLREAALREILDAATRQREANGVDTREQTGSVAGN